MVRTITSRMLLAAALVAGLAACGNETPAEQAPADAVPAAGAPSAIKERQDNFKAIGKAFKAVRAELEKDTPDFGVISTNANEINTLGAKIEGYFPAGTSVEDGYKTEALPAIWAKPEEFKAANQKLLDESAKLSTVAADGDKAAVTAQVMALGGACKGCHEKFRVDDEK